MSDSGLIYDHKLVTAMWRAGHRDGGAMVGGPPRIVLHTSEGRTGPGALLTLNAGLLVKRFAYHLGVDLPTRTVDQYVPFDRAASTLRRPTSLQTNRQGSVCIQICLTGRSADVRSIPADDLRWLGREVLYPIMRAYGVPDVWATFVGPEAGVIATPTAPQRFTADEWVRFSGVCGHQHVPGNDHWDPGVINVEAIRQGIWQAGLGAAGTDARPQEVAPMYSPPLVLEPIAASCQAPQGGVWLVATSGAVYAFGAAPYCGGANGQPYFVGRNAARIEPNARGGYDIIATSGERYSYPV
jgi:hypothetical protein